MVFEAFKIAGERYKKAVNAWGDDVTDHAIHVRSNPRLYQQARRYGDVFGDLLVGTEPTRRNTYVPALLEELHLDGTGVGRLVRRFTGEPSAYLEKTLTK